MIPPTLTAVGRRTTRGADETRGLGGELAALLAAGDLVALTGDLGTGKTCLVQGIAAGLGVTEVVNSPTFVLLNVYAGRAAAGPLTVYHVDLYRLASREELEGIGFAELYDDADAVTLVEWADRVPELLPPTRWEIHLEHGAVADERQLSWRRLLRGRPAAEHEREVP